MSLSFLVLIASSVGPAAAEPLTTVEDPPASEIEARLPSDGATPLTPEQDPPTTAIEVRLPSDGAAPLAGPRLATQPHAIPSDGVEPFRRRESTAAARAPVVATPFGVPVRVPRPRLDPKTARIVRFDVSFGPMWRIRRVDTMIASGVEVGPMHGFSAAFHWAVLVDTQREVVRALDAPIGFGAIARGRLRKHPLFGSVGLTVGTLVHRAKTERGVIHRVDPDFRLPIRFAWTIATVGISLVLEQGYSVRNRHYERRGVEVWARHAYRVGFAIGLHSDIMAGRATQSRLLHRRSRRRDATR